MAKAIKLSSAGYTIYLLSWQRKLLKQKLLCFDKTRFQLILPVWNHDVTKNLTGHRMNVEGTQIYHMNRQTNSFQNMYDML